MSVCVSDGNFLAVSSHDNFVYIYGVTENGRKYNRMGKCTVSIKNGKKICLMATMRKHIM